MFALLADVQDAEPIPRSAAVRMAKEPNGPTTTGTRWHEWVRVMPGYWFHVESVVPHVHEPHQLSMDFYSRWLTGHLIYEIERRQTEASCTIARRYNCVSSSGG